MSIIIIITCVLIILAVILYISINKNHNNLDSVLDRQFLRLQLQLTEHLNDYNEKLSDKTNYTFNSIIERLTRIDTTQQKIDELSTQILTLQDVLNDKRARGVFGEIQLKHVLSSTFGDSSNLYALQHRLDNDTIVDSMLFAPAPLGAIAIDAKFPFENYRKMVDSSLPDAERKRYAKLFEGNVKLHIDAIADKYIIPNKTSSSAIMFIPAEAVFAQIHANHANVIEYANTRKVWITSPTTLIAILSTIQMVVQNLEQAKNINIIQDKLRVLSSEFKDYKEHFDNLTKHLRLVNKDLRELDTRSDRIINEFDDISNCKLDGDTYSSAR